LRERAQNVDGIGERLKQARSKLAMTQKEMARTLGMSLRTYAASEAEERTMDVGEVARLAKLDIDIAWFLTGRESAQNDHSSAIADRSAGAGLGDDFVLLPRYDVQASAGSGMVIHSEQIVDYLAFKADWVRDRLGRNASDLLLIEASGDSMSPTIAHGDLLLIDRSTAQLRDSAIYVLANDGELMVKRVERRVTGGVVIKSDNPRYDPETLSAEEASFIRVIGQVLWHGGLV
jgi:phage repressor protein C with HTH and peptisase S24 domain